VDAQAHEASVFDEARSMMRESSVTSMFPPQTSTATFFPTKGSLRLTRAAMAAAPAPSARVFLVRAAAGWRGDFFFFDGYDIVHVFLNQRQGALASTADGDAIGDGGGGCECHGLAFGDRNFHRRQTRRLNSEDLNFSIRMALDSLSAQAMPPIRPPPPMGTTTLRGRGAVRGVPARWCLAPR